MLPRVDLRREQAVIRHLNHLKHLVAKLQGRYGNADPHVQEIITQLQGLEAGGSRQRPASAVTQLRSSNGVSNSAHHRSTPS